MIVTVLAWLTPILIGLAIALWQTWRAERLNKARRRLDWVDVLNAARRVKKDLPNKKLVSAIVTPGTAGAAFAGIVSESLPNKPPVYVGVRHWLADGKVPPASAGWTRLLLTKWAVDFPPLPPFPDKGLILVVDDWAHSGDFLLRMRTMLINLGLDAGRIKTATIATTKVAMDSNKAPDYWYWEAEAELFFPWGQAR